MSRKFSIQKIFSTKKNQNLPPEEQFTESDANSEQQLIEDNNQNNHFLDLSDNSNLSFNQTPSPTIYDEKIFPKNSDLVSKSPISRTNLVQKNRNSRTFSLSLKTDTKRRSSVDSNSIRNLNIPPEIAVSKDFDDLRTVDDIGENEQGEEREMVGYDEYEKIEKKEVIKEIKREARRYEGGVLNESIKLHERFTLVSFSDSGLLMNDSSEYVVLVSLLIELVLFGKLVSLRLLEQKRKSSIMNRSRSFLKTFTSGSNIQDDDLPDIKRIDDTSIGELNSAQKGTLKPYGNGTRKKSNSSIDVSSSSDFKYQEKNVLIVADDDKRSTGDNILDSLITIMQQTEYPMHISVDDWFKIFTGKKKAPDFEKVKANPFHIQKLVETVAMSLVQKNILKLKKFLIVGMIPVKDVQVKRELEGQFSSILEVFLDDDYKWSQFVVYNLVRENRYVIRVLVMVVIAELGGTSNSLVFKSKKSNKEKKIMQNRLNALKVFFLKFNDSNEKKTVGMGIFTEKRGSTSGLREIDILSEYNNQYKIQQYVQRKKSKDPLSPVSETYVRTIFDHISILLNSYTQQ